MLSLIISRESAMASDIEEPSITDRNHAQWEKDRKLLEHIEGEFDRRRIPVPSFPLVTPQMGKATAEYDITIDGDNPVSTVLGPHLPAFIDTLMRFKLQSAYQQAIGPMWGWHRQIRKILARYGVWDMDSEFSAALSSVSDADLEKDFERTKRYTRGMAGESSRAEVVDVDPESDSTDDDDDNAGEFGSG